MVRVVPPSLARKRHSPRLSSSHCQLPRLLRAPPPDSYPSRRRRSSLAAAAARPPPSSSSSTSSSPASPSSTRPLRLLRPPLVTSAPRRWTPQSSLSSSLLAPPTSPTWRTARAGPSLRMPGAGNTDLSPGLASLVRCFVNFVFVRLHMPSAGTTGACLRPRCVPGLGKPATTHRQQHLLPGAPLLRHTLPRPC